MTESRLIQDFTIASGANVVRITHSADANSPFDLTFTPGTFRHTDNGGADDVVGVLETDLNAAAATTTWTVQIVGVNGLTAAGVASGRIRIAVDSGTFILEGTAGGNTTLPAGPLGWNDTGNHASTLTVLVSDFVHRYGLYFPQTWQQAGPDDPVLLHAAPQTSDNQIPAAVTWGTSENANPFWSWIPEEFIRRAAASTSGRMTANNLTVDDPWCSLQQFVLDAAENNAWIRAYADSDDEATFLGPFRLPGTNVSDFRRDPVRTSWQRDSGSPNWSGTVPLVDPAS